LVRDCDEGIEAFDIRWQARSGRRDTAIAGRTKNFLHARRLAQLPHQGVLAPSAADDKNFHD
jgi:hypothetical protein